MDSINKSSYFESSTYISIVVAVVSFLVFNFLTIWFTFWGKKVKCDLGIPVLGTHWREIFKMESWHGTIKRLYYKYPNEPFVVMQDIGGRPAYLIRDPELVKKVAVSDFSSFVNRISGFHPVTDPVQGHKLTNTVIDDWRRIRNLVTPLLTGQKLKQIMIPAFNENKRELVKFLSEEMEKAGDNELAVDMMDLGTRSVVDGFCLIALGVKTDSLHSNPKQYGFIESALSFLKYRSEMSKATYWAIIYFPRIMKYLFGKTLMPVRDNDFFIESCEDIADNRNNNQINRTDFIQLLQTLRDTSSKSADKKTRVDYTEIEAISQLYDFFQSILTENNIITAFLAQQLAKDSEVQDLVYNECVKLKERVGDNELTYDDINEMKYTEMVIHEGLRLCPIVTELKRRATKKYVLENYNGEKVAINPGDAVWLPSYTLQNDPQYYPNPSAFDPGRFSDENKKSHVTGTYAPFGLGPRDCIGCKHPIFELKIMMYYLLLDFKIEPVEKGADYNKHTVKLRRRN